MRAVVAANSSVAPERSARSQLFTAGFVAAVFIVCATRLIGLVNAYAVDVLFEDQWNALQPLFDGQGPWSAFLHQHGPPRLGVGGAMDWILFHATRWDNRAESWAGLVTLILATLAALALSVRIRGHLSWRDAGFPLLILSGVHWETLVFTPFAGAQLIPLLLVLLLAAGWTFASTWIRALAVSAVSVLLLFSGYGFCAFPLGAALAIWLWWRAVERAHSDSRRLAIVVVLASAAALAGFVASYAWSPGTTNWRFPVPNWWDYPRFMALMFTNLLGWRAVTLGSTLAGALLLLLVMGAWFWATFSIWHRRSSPRVCAVWTLAGAALLYTAFTAVGRLPSNIQAAFMWRYTTLTMPGLCALAIAAEAWTMTLKLRWRAATGLAWLLLTAVIWSNFTPEVYAATVAREKRRWVASYRATHDLAAANRESQYWVCFLDPDSPDIAAKLRWLEARRLSFFRDDK